MNTRFIVIRLNKNFNGFEPFVNSNFFGKKKTIPQPELYVSEAAAEDYITEYCNDIGGVLAVQKVYFSGDTFSCLGHEFKV